MTYPTMTLEQLLELDLDSNQPCHFCGKSLVVKEGFIEGTDEESYLLCDFCVQYNSYDEVRAAWAEIVKLATNPELSTYYGYPWI
jgi:hypothetical protein